MSVGALGPQQLKSLIEDKWQRDLDAAAVGLHVAPSWQGPSEVKFEFGPAAVVRADTVFEVREALLDAERRNGRIVLLTKLQQADLGHDVIARLARSRLFPVDHWVSLCSLFKAKELDRSICDPAIAQSLIEFAPPDGYPPVSAGVLDAGTVWRALCRHVFEMGEREPDLVSLLLWAASRKGAQRYRQANEEIRESLRGRLTRNLGDAAESVLRFLEHGAGPDTLALSVVCQVVFGDGDEVVLDAAAARMEQYHGNQPISMMVGRTLGRAVVDAIADLDRHEDPRIAQNHLQRADQLLRQFRCEEYAYRNGLSPLGFEQRLARLGAQIKQTLESPSDDTVAGCEGLLERVSDHRMARRERWSDHVLRAEMAVRLVRWLRGSATVPASFSEQASHYLRELSFVDWAREPLCRGEDIPELSSAYQCLDQAVAERRAGFSHAFAQSLADWSSVGSTPSGVLGVEDVLDQIVAPVIKSNNRVLLIVLDGMSWAVCHELLDDIRQDHWFEATLDESYAPPPPVVATVPSATNCSRASLLSGTLAQGDAGLEKKNFKAHKALSACCDKRYPPVLFHKKDITEGSRGTMSQQLSDTVLCPDRRVVGVVINAVDDRLANAQQVIDRWTISRIGPLGPLLRLARDAGRVVILASDHGHVWHRPDAEYRPHELGSRWRPEDGTCAGDEIVISGKRVLGDGNGNSVIVPWTETVYYGRQQNGYHGGATPQEMACPLVLLTDPSSAYSGLSDCEYPKPDWWWADPVGAPVTDEPPVKVAVPTGPPTLFDHLPEADEAVPSTTEAEGPAESEDWIERLLASSAYKDQKALIRRHAPDDTLVRAGLMALCSQGDIMTPAAFAKAIGIPLARLDGLVAQMQRVLNVDGYEILRLDRSENRVELNVAKLKRQFDLN